MRGEHRGQRVHHQAGWFIPAYAGWVPPRRIFRGGTWVYPRVCGVGASGSRKSSDGRGLSPRVRGGLTDLLDDGVVEGFIPACAGWVVAVSPVLHFFRVYPRVCGVGVPMRLSRISWMGLSPRVRGGPSEFRRSAVVMGFIPACAGWVCFRRMAARSTQVYPRVCGVGTLIFKGSRPYEWGKKLDCSTQSAWRVSLPSDSTHALPSRMRTLPVCTVGSLLRVYSMMPEVCPYVVRTSWM